jgi:hypothetical protein
VGADILREALAVKFRGVQQEMVNPCGAIWILEPFLG